VNEGFRLRLFLEAFGLRAGLLNAELPLNSRAHILASFNRGLFDYLIATDDVHAGGEEPGAGAGKKGGKAAPAAGGRGAKRPRKDEEFGVTRGIDFKGVSTVVNVELPAGVAGYVHRVGRTGRAGASGAAFTLFSPEDAPLRVELEAAPRGRAHDVGRRRQRQRRRRRRRRCRRRPPRGAQTLCEADARGGGGAALPGGGRGAHHHQGGGAGGAR